MADGDMKRPGPIGGDLVIPLIAIGFAVNFFVDIADLAWEARANGTVIGVLMLTLIAVLFVRMGLALARGQADLGIAPALLERALLVQRLGLVGLMVLFLVTLPWLGVTLGLVLFLGASTWLLGARDRGTILLAVLGIPTAVYLAFFVLLRSRLPQGPIEWALGRLTGLGG